MPYVIKNIYARQAYFIDMPDFDFIAQCIDVAKRDSKKFAHVDKDAVKQATPAICASNIEKRTKQENIVTRDVVTGRRALRSFLMIDADFSAHESEKSQGMRCALIELANMQNTPLIIYPTASYPEKPRFRACLFSEEPLGEVEHVKAISWLYESVGQTPTDDSDFRISANRNLPVFTNQEQLEAIYIKSTGDALKNALWAKTRPLVAISRAKSRAKSRAYEQDSVEAAIERHRRLYSFDALKSCMTSFKKDTSVQTYEGVWPVLYSIAAAVYTNSITREQAYELTDILASATEDAITKAAWAAGNREKLADYVREIDSSAGERIIRIRPLTDYGDFYRADLELLERAKSAL